MEIFFICIKHFIGSQFFANLLLLITVIVAFLIGRRQIFLNDVVEIYASPASKQIQNSKDSSIRIVPIINLQNTGTRIVYLDKYIFNGVEYLTDGQVLPPTYFQSNALYWIDLPLIESGVIHVSVFIFYHDLDKRKWKSEVIADFLDNTWKIKSLPRTLQL